MVAKGLRRRYAPDFQARVALAAVKEVNATLVGLASRFEVHPSLVGKWKARLLKNAAALFGQENPAVAEEAERRQERLRRAIDRQDAEIERLKQAVVAAGDLHRRRTLVERERPSVPIKRQCELLGLSRSGVYRRPVRAARAAREEREKSIKAAINAAHLRRPTYGFRRMYELLCAEGLTVTKKGVRRLMREMGLCGARSG